MRMGIERKDRARGRYGNREMGIIEMVTVNLE